MQKLHTTSTVESHLLTPNPWNTNRLSPENEFRIEASLRRLGMFKPIVARQLADGTLQILGGQHRWEAAVRLGIRRLPVVNVGVVDDKQAKEISLVDNGRYGEDDPLALSTLLKELGTPEELMGFLPYTELDLTNIFAAESIAMDDLSLGADTELPEPAARPAPTHQVMRFKIPVEDIAWITTVIEKMMRDKNFTAEDSLSNAGNAVVELMKVHK